MKVKRITGIFLGYNASFIVWSGFAVSRVFSNTGTGIYACPLHKFFGHCPGCGLTGSYVQLLKGNGFVDSWFTLIFAGFILNFLRSVLVAARTSF